MSHKIAARLTLLLTLAMTPAVLARNVFVTPPGDGTVRPVAPFVGDPFAPGVGSILAAQDTFMVLSTPSGNKFYFIGRSGTDTVVVTDANFQVIARRNLGTGATAAAMTPDGRYLVVTAGTVQVISTATDTVATQLDGGTSPNDVAISRDGSRAYVTSQLSARLTVIDLNTFGTVTALQNLGPVNGVSVGPNALIYVSATNILYEIDPRDFSFRGGAGIPLNAQPGKPVLIGDSLGAVRAVMANLNPGFGGSSAITVDLGTRTATPILAGGVVLDRLIPVSGTRVVATSQTGQLYDISLPGTITPASFTGLSSTAGIRAAVASDEFPNARFLYVVSSATNTISRIDLFTNTVSGSFTLTSPPGGLSYAGAAATGVTPSSVFLFNNGQFVNPSGQTLPLVVRAVDATGRPLMNTPVQYSTTASGVFFTTPQTVFTNGEGYAQATLIAPSTLGSFQVTVTVGSGIVQTATFNLTVGTGTTGATGLITIRGGNGQIIREGGVTPELLRVVVRDTAGNPVPNAIVTWTVTSSSGSPGSVLQTQTVTDFLGESTNIFVAPFLGPNLLTSYVQSTITASTFSGSVNFYVTVIPNQFGNNPAAPPVVQLVQPLGVEEIRAQAGTTVPGAIQVRITAGSGPGIGTPIPNVAVQVSTGLDPLVAPSARCREETSLTDANGLATCDLVVGSRIGTATLSVTVAGTSTATLTLIVTPGLPGKIVVLQGDNQSGNAGQLLPLALLARVEDSFGNPLPGAQVSWAVESGSATLVSTITTSDNFARVSTLVRLGGTPGPVRIRVTAVGGVAEARATFNLNVVLAVTQLRRISGDGQSAIVNQPFGEPLVAQVLDANNQPVPAVAVAFSVRSGSATLSAASANSDANGQVRVNVTAGATPGAVVIAAEVGGNTVTWSLTVRPLGPTISPNDIVNAASGQPGIAPGAIVIIRGANIVPNIRGYVLPPNEFGPRPGSLAGVSVTFGGVLAPIFWAANIDGRESVAVQVPFEVPDTGVIPVTVTSSGTSATVNVTSSPVSPGIFEAVDALNRRYAVVTRLDGTFVTPDNPIGRGEVARVYVTGLGRTNSAAFTNAYGGADQKVIAPVIVGINDAGVRVISAEYAQNLIGVYVVTFEVPADTTPGQFRNFGLAVDAGGGNLVFANGSTIAIR